ncbi:MAG: LLM class flavin-dependent oxidoreductase [Acidimicrobiia bacterium]|nr:LLM class flavin-dependent oxidoreductase [Acidimicrobiia bacterium]
MAVEDNSLDSLGAHSLLPTAGHGAPRRRGRPLTVDVRFVQDLTSLARDARGGQRQGRTDHADRYRTTAAIPAAPAPSVGAWAQAAEQSGFQSVSVIDRLVYDNLDPIVALAAAAAVTERVELLTTVLNVPYRTNGLVLAKQLASLDAIAGDA